MSVYVITDRAAGVCKIGFSKTPLRRLAMLRTSSAADLDLEAVIPGDRNCEADLHAEHSANLVRREWYKISPAIEQLIAAFPRGFANRRSLRTTDLARLAGISMAYASQIIGGKRKPPRPLAIHILRTTGWRHSVLDGLTDEQIDMLEQIEPYQPKQAA